MSDAFRYCRERKHSGSRKRLAALEEAARVADGFAKGSTSPERRGCYETIAAAIRQRCEQ